MASFFSPSDRAFARAISRVAYCNPFLPERIDLEREALGSDFADRPTVWSKVLEPPGESHPNVQRMREKAETLAEKLRQRLRKGARPETSDVELYEDLVLFVLFHDYDGEFHTLILDSMSAQSGPPSCKFYLRFREAAERFFEPGPRDVDITHLFAIFFQVRRAFHHIFDCIVGESMPAARLRAAAWQSIFTHDMRRYRRALYDRMADVACLISGESGTGKELVARSIGLSRYIPFDPAAMRFTEDFAGSFFPLNVSALSPTLIESELFGHRRGAFTGAIQDRTGWFEVCPPLGTVFLDEIGEIDVSIQVKLLRVLETRTFQRIGDTKERMFRGKIIAATNRDLSEEMREGRFRNDLYYRLCSDLIVTPPLRAHFRDSRDALHDLVRHVAQRLTNEEEAAALAAEAMEWIEENLEADYPWPGNFRELEQCLRNILIRKVYQPARGQSRSAREDFARAVEAGELTADVLLKRYCTLVYVDAGTYQAAARRLGLDHRTIKGRIDRDWLKALGQPAD